MAFARTSFTLGSTYEINRSDELVADREIADLITSYAAEAGYSSTFNYYGNKTTPGNILLGIR